jgi:hypothetical protein
LSDLVVPEFCPVLNIRLVFNRGKPGGSHNSPSLDRIVPELGYAPGNVRVISDRANKLRNDATADELEAVARDARALTNIAATSES